jgi:hypothetical protein
MPRFASILCTSKTNLITQELQQVHLRADVCSDVFVIYSEVYSDESVFLHVRLLSKHCIIGSGRTNLFHALLIHEITVVDHICRGFMVP